MHSSVDINLCELIAQVWLDNDADAEGFAYCWRDVLSAIRRLEVENKDDDAWLVTETMADVHGEGA